MAFAVTTLSYLVPLGHYMVLEMQGSLLTFSARVDDHGDL
ncbi:hypothetical protein X769_32645 [Mesorhizobium sp. LSJC268A00]|nr:hypothetical protein X769_32645 [Mesorhizobium sp. LSJC268A00]